MTSQLHADVYAALDHQWCSRTEIWKRMGCWSRSSVGHRLTAMLADGVVETRLVKTPQGELREWRIAAQEEAE